MIIWGHGRRRATVGVSWPGRGDAIRERSAQVGPLPVVHQRQRSAARRGSFLLDVGSPRIRRAVALSASGQFCGNFRTSHALVSKGASARTLGTAPTCGNRRRRPPVGTSRAYARWSRGPMRATITLSVPEPIYLRCLRVLGAWWCLEPRSEEHTSELQSQSNLVCRLLLENQ